MHYGIFKRYFRACLPLIDRKVVSVKRGKEGGDDMQQRAIGWNQTCGLCGKHTAFVHGAPVLPGELMGAPVREFLMDYMHYLWGKKNMKTNT